MSATTATRRAVAPLAHTVLNRTYPPLGRRRFQAAFAAAQARGDVRIAIGSGRIPLPGWINTDVVWQQALYLDATAPWPVPAGSVDFVYGDNVIEHVTLEQAGRLFRHAFAAMRPGGVIRLATPDVEASARFYLERGAAADEGMQRNRELGKPFRHHVELIRETLVGSQHYLGFCYDYPALQREMTDAGFSVVRAETGRSEHPVLRDLEARTHPAEVATTLVVEGTRPA